MREALDMMPFVQGAYAVTIIAVVALLVSSWMGMKRAEKKREESRGRKGEE